MVVTCAAPAATQLFRHSVKMKDTSRLVDFPANCDVEVIVRSEVSHPKPTSIYRSSTTARARKVAFDRSPTRTAWRVFTCPWPIATRFGSTTSAQLRTLCRDLQIDPRRS